MYMYKRGVPYKHIIIHCIRVLKYTSRRIIKRARRICIYDYNLRGPAYLRENIDICPLDTGGAFVCTYAACIVYRPSPGPDAVARGPPRERARALRGGTRRARAGRANAAEPPRVRDTPAAARTLWDRLYILLCTYNLRAMFTTHQSFFCLEVIAVRNISDSGDILHPCRGTLS